ncbi:MAG: SHOCT domain-containing protein [Acidobacteriota bacterium]
MKSKVSIRPTKPVTVMALVVAVAMALLGIFFLGLLIKEGAGVGIVFMIFWFIVLGVIITYYIYNLKSRKGIAEIETETDSESAPRAGESAPDFDGKLRKLEALKRDGLLTDEEYQAKRAEIMKKAW